MTPAISVDRLSKTFGNVRALDAVSIEINPGERVALIGASGSGKSTLIRHIGGLTTGDRSSGAVKVFGETMQSGGSLTGQARRLRCDVGMIFQQFNLVGRMSVIGNVLVGLLGHVPGWRGTFGLFTKAEKRRAMEALDTVGIASFAAQRAARLSGGQQQRVAIARSLVQQAKIVLADEPIASLDPKSAKRVMEILLDLNKRYGITLVTSLHQVDYAMAFFDRMVALKDGRIVYDGPTKDLSVAFLTELYGAQAEELILPGQLGPAEAQDTANGASAPPPPARNGQDHAAGSLTAGV